MRYNLPLPPPLNQTYRAAYRPSLGRTAFFMDSKASSWKQAAQVLLKLKCRKLIEGNVEVFVYWFLKRDRDCDAGLKLVLDALQGTVITNDSQVTALHASKEKVSGEPCCQVEVNEI